MSTAERTLVLKNLPQDVTEQSISQMLSPFGSILSIKLPRGPNGSKGYAFVEFSSKSTVSNVLAVPLYLHNQPIIVEPHDPDVIPPHLKFKRNIDWQCSTCKNYNFGSRNCCVFCGSAADPSTTASRQCQYYTDTLIIRHIPPTTSHADVHAFIKSNCKKLPRSAVFSRKKSDVFVAFDSPNEALSCLRCLQRRSPCSVSEGVVCPDPLTGNLTLCGELVSVCFARSPTAGDGKRRWEEAPEELKQRDGTVVEKQEELKDDSSVDWIMATFREIASERKDSNKTTEPEIPKAFVFDQVSGLYYLPGTFKLFDHFNNSFYEFNPDNLEFTPIEPLSDQQIDSILDTVVDETQTREEIVIPSSTSSLSFSTPSRWKGFPVLKVDSVSRSDRAEERRKKEGIVSSRQRIQTSSSSKPLSIKNKGRLLLEHLGFVQDGKDLAAFVPPMKKGRRGID
ncbi:hypothetical protein P9112_012564 [Eukaryota sp. TZLM1-RC]